MRPPSGSWPDVHARTVAELAPTLASLASLWGLHGAFERLPGGEDCAAFAIQDLVVKLVPPEGAAASVREARLLSRVRLPVPIPRLLDRQVTEGWTAMLLTRVPGLPVGQVWPDLDEDQRERVLFEIGQVAAVVRGIPTLPTDPRPPRTPRHGDAAAAWVERWGPAEEDEVLLHGDLTTENVLFADGHVSGIVDFGGSFAGPALVEMVSPGLFLAAAQPRRLRALLRGAEIDACPEALLAAHLLHPYSQLARDWRMLGLATDAPLDQAMEAWRAA